MRFLKHLTVVLSLVIVLAGGGSAPRAQTAAPSEEALAVATALLGALGLEKQFESVLPVLLQQFRGVILQANPRAGEELGMTNVAFPSIGDYQDIETRNLWRTAVDERGEDPATVLRSIHAKGHGEAPQLGVRKA